MTTTLPTWADLSDVDKGCVLLHLHKRGAEGASYAEEHYPARFLDDPALRKLPKEDACEFAVSMNADANRLRSGEFVRLYDLALDAETAR